MSELARGENTTIATGAVTVSVAGARQGTVDAMVCELGVGTVFLPEVHRGCSPPDRR